MDFSFVLAVFDKMPWFVIPLLVSFFALSIILKTAWFKGVMGEWMVNVLIKLRLNKRHYHLIKNVTLPTEDGSTQIDHIIVSPFGVFVIETKNMKGWIFGSEHQKEWTQKVYRYSSTFQNPLHQNYKHTKTLEGCLDIASSRIFSVIIFIGDSILKTKLPANVAYARGAIKYIKSKTAVILSNQEVTEIIDKIKNGRLQAGFETNRQHIAHVNDIVSEKSSSKVADNVK